MSDRNLTVNFARLFAGRGDAWGAVEGRSVKKRVTMQLFADHLWGDGSIGIYPLVPFPYSRTHTDPKPDMGWVHWGCIDVDEGYDLIAIARNLEKAFKALDITAWIERTKGKGYHIWTFYDMWTIASEAVAVQRVACQIADYHPKEVNPKQTDPRGKLGNYVNLPYSKWFVSAGKRVVLEGDDPLPLETFVKWASASRASQDVIAKAASLYTTPPPPKPIKIERPTVDPTPRLRGAARCLFEDGPLPNRNTGHIDRSAGLQRLAHLLRTDGFSAGEAYLLVADLDSRLGKYVGRADAELQYSRIIERAFG